MKRPDTNVLFAPIAAPAVVPMRNLASLILDELDGSISNYFGRLRFDSAENEYDLYDESLDLQNRSHLLERVTKERNAMCKFRAPMKFANGDMYVGYWTEADDRVTFLLEIDPAITRFIENDLETRIPFVGFLSDIARVFDSEWFVSGLHIPWRSLSRTVFLAGKGLGPSPFVVGWKAESFNDSEIVKSIGANPSDVQAIVPLYKFLFLM